MADGTARHAVNEAQFGQLRQQVQYGQEEADPQLDQLRRMEHSTQFMDLVADPHDPPRHPKKPPDRGGPNHPRHSCLTFPPPADRFGVHRRSTGRQP
nr:DUF6192 family protein [Streptomyces sp. BK022]